MLSVTLTAPSQKSAVLVVDDDESLLLTTTALLEDDFHVATARSGREALAYLASPQGRDVEVLCTDLRMPGMDGLELLGHAAQSRPGIAAILITAYRDYLSYGHTGNIAYDVLLKPYSPEDLVERVRRAAQRGQLKVSLDRMRGPPAPGAAAQPSADSNGVKRGTNPNPWRTK